MKREKKIKYTHQQIMDMYRVKNEKRFFSKYPDLIFEKIDNLEQFVPYVQEDPLSKYAAAKNPDTSFCAFILAFMMCLVSIVVFYGDRDFANEYFTRQVIYKRLEQNPFGFFNYNEVKTADDLYLFITDSVAN